MPTGFLSLLHSSERHGQVHFKYKMKAYELEIKGPEEWVWGVLCQGQFRGVSVRERSSLLFLI